MCFFNKAVKTKYAYAYLERSVPNLEIKGVPRYSERNDSNYKVLPCAELDKKFCTYSFWAKVGGLELEFRIRYSRLNKMLYLYVNFENLEFYRLSETQERLKEQYKGVHFKFNPKSTEVCIFEIADIKYMDDIATLCQRYVDRWNECGVYEDLLDYYNMFK